MISVTILTKNSSKRLKTVLDALKNFDEVLIYDTGSKDNTLEIANEYPNVTIHRGTLEGFGPTHNKASSLAKNDWIFSCDSDEIATDGLVKEIASLQLDSEAVYFVSRKNYFQGKWIRWCGWHPDFQPRLYNRTKTSFTNAHVHESIQTEGMKKIRLKNPLIHYSYDTLSDFLSKMQSYSTLFAEENQEKRKSSPLKALTHAWWAFFKSYVLKRGFLGGYEGFVISAYNGHTAFYKYLKLYEANKLAKIRLCPEERGSSCSSSRSCQK